MRRRNLNEEYLNSVRSSDGKSAHSSVTLEHTTEASAGFAQLLRQQKRGGGSKDANVIDIGPRKSIFAALNAHSNSLFGNSSDAFFDENNDDAREGAYHLGWRTFIAAAVLLVIGIILLVVGLRVYLKSNSDSVHNGLEMIVLGCVCTFFLCGFLSVYFINFSSYAFYSMLFSSFYSIFAWFICWKHHARNPIRLGRLSLRQSSLLRSI